MRRFRNYGMWALLMGMGGAVLPAIAQSCPLAPCGPVVFQNSACSNAAWTMLDIIQGGNNAPGFFRGSPIVIPSLTFPANGGNPGCFERLTINVPNAPSPTTEGAAFIPVLMVGATYTPSSSGPIQAINYYEDSISISGAPSSTCVIFQGGEYFSAHARRISAGSPTWVRQCIMNLVVTDFENVRRRVGDSTGPNNPNFSSSGSVMNFGIIRANSTGAGGGGYTTISGFDNVTVQIVPPAPAYNTPTGCIPLTVNSGNDAGNNCCATTDGSSSCGGVNDIWACFTAYCTNPITIRTCGSNFDTVLSVHNDAPGTVANEVACNDDASAGPCFGTTQSELTFTPTPCTTYYIRVAGFSAADCGNVVITIDQPITAPANNNCSSPQTVANGTTAFSTCGATTDGPAMCSLAQNDVWFRYVATCDGYFTVAIPQTASFDAALGVYCDSCNPITQLACVNNACPPGPFPCFGLSCGSRLIEYTYARVKCRAGQAFRIRVGGVGGQTGVGELNISCAASVPDNNNCANALPVIAGQVISGSTVGATPTGGSIASPTSRDVWYEFFPSCNGAYTIDTCAAAACDSLDGPSYNTLVSVHTDCSGLFATQVAFNDNFCGLRSRTTFNATACTRYLIRVAGSTAADFGDFTLQVSGNPTAPAPANNNCAGASAPPYVIAPTGETKSFSTCGATTTTGVPNPSFSIFNDVWFCYTPQCAGQVRVSTCNSPLGSDSALAVYSGPCTSLSLIASNDNALAGNCIGTTLSYVTFNATAFTTYYIRVGSAVNGQTFCGRLNVVGPIPATPTCPTAGGLAGIRWFQVMGPSNNTPWSWCLSSNCCFSVSGSSAGEPITTPVVTSRNALATRFSNSINASCGNSVNLVATPTLSTTNPGVFSIKARCPAPYAFPFFVFSVGPLGTACANQCVVQEVGGIGIPDPIPTSGPCSFNPEIIELPQSGLDCNANGIDDFIDIHVGTSADVNGNGVPDSCEGHICDSIDFNNDTSVFDPIDIDAFLSVYGEGPCLPIGAACNDIDFNNDGSLFDPCDIDSFLLMFSEGPCTPCGL